MVAAQTRTGGRREMLEQRHQFVLGRHAGPAQQTQPALGIAAVAGVAGQRHQRQRPRRIQRLRGAVGRLGLLEVTEAFICLGPQPAQRWARGARCQRLHRLGKQPQGDVRTVLPRTRFGQHGGRDGRLGEELQGRADRLVVGVARLPAGGRRRVQPRRQLRHDAGKVVLLAAVLSSRHGLDQVECLLVEPHRCQHGERLVIVELVARLDCLDPARQAPRAEIEAATGNPVALVGQAGSRKHIAERCRRFAEHAVVPGAHRPDGNIEHLRPITEFPEQAGQRRADVARPHVGRGEVEAVRGDAQPDEITGRDAQRGKPPGRQQQHPLAVDSSLGHPACGEDVAVEERGHVGDRRVVGEPLIGLGLGQHRQRRQIGTQCDDVVLGLHRAEAVGEDPPAEQSGNPSPPLVGQRHDQLGVLVKNVGEHAVRIGPQVDAVRVEHLQQVVLGHRTAHRKNLPHSSNDRLTGNAGHYPDATRPHAAIPTVHPGSRPKWPLSRSDRLPADSQLRPSDTQSRAR